MSVEPGAGNAGRSSIAISTDDFPPDVRSDAWREIISPFFETQATDHTENGHLNGAMTSLTFGSLLIGKTQYNAQRYLRSRKLVLTSGLDQYLIQLLTAGVVEGDCDGTPIRANPGDIFALDLSRASNMQVSSGSTVSVMVPRDLIDKAGAGRSVHGTVLKAERPITQLLASLLIGMTEVADEMDGEPARAIENGVVTLIAEALVRGGGAAPMSDDPLATRVLRSQVLSYISANLASPDLTPTAIMERFHVSRAHLYRVFAADGGIASVIRDKRLDAAYRSLTSPDARNAVSITRLAHELSFSDSNHFLRAFRARFGITPSEARELTFSFQLDERDAAALHNHFSKYLQDRS